MGKRSGSYYPTDPRAVEALWLFFTKMCWHRPDRVWLDPAAGYGGLLEKFALPHRRAAIEIEPRFEPLLRERVPCVTIGNGLDTSFWPPVADLIANPPYDHKICTQFADVMLQSATGVPRFVVLLVLTTWARSKSAEKLFRRYRPPDWVLGHAFRLSCDGTGRGDSRTHDWLVWQPRYSEVPDTTRYRLLPEPEVPESEMVLHRLMARRVGELFAEEEVPT